MKILVVHKKDVTTDFLMPIYADINATVVRQNIASEELDILIKKHDRVVMLGHGSPQGLFDTGNRGPGSGYIISSSTARVLRKKDNIYIWCYAAQYVQRHNLTGFATGMFISDTLEAQCCGIGRHPGLLEEVESSNRDFASIIKHQILVPSGDVLAKAVSEYLEGDPSSEVRKYNAELMRKF